MAAYTEMVDRFEEFLREAYEDELGRAEAEGDDAVVVDFSDLERFNNEFADEVVENPGDAVDAAEEALGLLSVVDTDLNIRFENLPERTEVKIRDLRSRHIGKMVAVEGLVKRASEVRPEVVSADFECQSCGDVYTREQDSAKLKSPYKCDCGNRKFEVVDKDMVDVQGINIEENPRDIEGSEQPRDISVYLREDLVDPEFQKNVTPGNQVIVNGILREAPQENDSKRYDIFMEGNFVDPKETEFQDINITEEEEAEITELAEDDDVFNRIVNSIAPSIYGHQKIKEAIALQLFGGVRKTRPDGTTTRGDMHILLIGEPGTGKCVAPDTTVTLNDGSEHRIKDIVEDNLDDPEEVDDGVYDTADIELPALNHNGTVASKTASVVWKREAPDEMYRIRTASGKEIEVTPSHPLFIQRGGNIAHVDASELEEGEFIATPREIDTDSSDTLSVDYRESEANNAVRLDNPDRLTPSLTRLLGYITAEGYIQETDDNTGTLYVTNNDEAVLEDVKDGLDRLGLNYSKRSPHPGKGAREVLCSSSEFISFLEQLEPELLQHSRERRVPEPILRASDQTKAAFLEAFVEGEGTVSRKEREICVGSTSKQLLEQVTSLLLSLGIRSQLQPREDSYRLRISGEDFDTYVNEVGFVTERKTLQTEKFDGTAFNTNTDVVPHTGEILREVREDLGMSQFDFPISRGAYQHYERLDRFPSRNNLQTVVDAFSERLTTLRDMKQQLKTPDWETVREVRRSLGASQQAVAEAAGCSQTLVSRYESGRLEQNQELLGDIAAALQHKIDAMLQQESTVRHLQELAESDIFWDRVVEIEAVEPDYDWVYDLQVEDTHNYITNNIFSHNSQVLQYVGELAPKGKYVVGKSATGAGITATVVRDEITDSWSLEAGALVLANKGIATIDEIDKMSNEDRSSLHEAMEQQTISVSKANIQATLQAQTAILAAGNPKFGRFDPYEPIPEQINIGDTLLSRFDLIFPVKDKPDEEKDRKLADHVMDMHTEPDQYQGDIETELLRKYIAYGKQNVHPDVTDAAKDKLKDFYVKIRGQGSDREGERSVPMTARQLEALIRLSEASARVRLSDTVDEEDAQRAIDLLTHSLKQIGTDPETGEFDIDRIESGMASSERDRVMTLRRIISDLQDDDEPVPVEDVLAEAEEQGISEANAQEALNRLEQQGEVYRPQQGGVSTL